MKKFFCRIALFLCLASLLSGAALAADKKVVLRMAGQNPLEHVSSKNMYKLKEIVERGTEGTVEVRVYPANQLGDYVQSYEELMRGGLDFALISVSPQFNRKFQIDGIPYLITDYTKLGKYTDRDGEFFRIMAETTAENSVHLLGFHFIGLMGIGSTKPIAEPLNPTVSDQGLLVRIPNKESVKMFLNNLGYKTISIAYAELFTALQTGVADGWWGGTANLNYIGFRDVVKHYHDLKLGLEQEYFMMSDMAWKKLSDAQREVILNAVRQIELESAQACAQEDAEYMEKLREHGISVHTYTEDEMRPVIEHVRTKIWPQYGKYVGDDIAKRIVDYFK